MYRTTVVSAPGYVTMGGSKPGTPARSTMLASGTCHSLMASRSPALAMSNESSVGSTGPGTSVLNTFAGLKRASTSRRSRAHQSSHVTRVFSSTGKYMPSRIFMRYDPSGSCSYPLKYFTPSSILREIFLVAAGFPAPAGEAAAADTGFPIPFCCISPVSIADV